MSLLKSLVTELVALEVARVETPEPQLTFSVGVNKVRVHESHHGGLRLESLDTDGDWQPAGTYYGETPDDVVALTADVIASLGEPGEPVYQDEVEFLEELTAALRDLPTSTDTAQDEVYCLVDSPDPDASLMVLIDYDGDQNMVVILMPSFVVADEDVSPADLGINTPEVMPADDVEAVATAVRAALLTLPEVKKQVFGAL